MATRQQLLAILSTAETGLARLAAEAVAERAYDDAAALLEAARRIQQIGEETRLHADEPPGGFVTPGASNSGAESKAAPAAPSMPAPIRRQSKSDYPRFFREGDMLVKVGWSRSERSEYEHKCSKRVLDCFIAELTRIAGPGKRFVMDKLLPLRDPDTKAEFPTYQPYLALAFLKQTGLVQQHGRSGYSIPKPSTLRADASAAWIGTMPR